MSDDTKMDFYLRNRALIEEWAALRGVALASLEEALFAAADQLGEDVTLPPPLKTNSIVALPITDDPLPLCRIELNWNRNRVFKGSGHWPEICIVMDPKSPKTLREAVRDNTAFAREPLGLVNTGTTPWWVRSGPVTPATEPIDMEPYAALCVERLRATWAAVHEVVRETIGNHPVDGGSSSHRPG